MLAASNWSGHQTRLSIVNLPAPISAPVDKPGHGRPVSGLRVPGSASLQRPRIPASSRNYLHNHRHSETVSRDCMRALRQSRHTLARLTLTPPAQSCTGPHPHFRAGETHAQSHHFPAITHGKLGAQPGLEPRTHSLQNSEWK